MHRIESSNMDVVNGKYLFKDGPPGTKMNAAWPNSLQEEICYVIEQAGLTILTKDTDTRTQLWEALQALGRPYDLVVSSQIVFNSMIERVGANHYQIKSQYKSVFVKNITGGYNATSWLSGGDSYGYLDTNQCTILDFEAGAYIGTGSTIFYLNCNTDNLVLNNVWIKGDGVTVTACTRSFRHYGYNVTYNNCRATDRYSNTTFNAFDGADAYGADPLRRKTMKMNGCWVSNSSSSGTLIAGFYFCNRLNNCSVESISATGAGHPATGFEACTNLSNCIALDINSASNLGNGFSTCYNLSSCTADDITGATGGIGFVSCNQVSASRAMNIGDVSTPGKGFSGCNQISACIASAITAINGIGGGYGFYLCNQVSGCLVDDISGSGNGYGFSTCYRISACYVDNMTAVITNVAFQNCKYISSVDTTVLASAGNDYVDTDDVSITNRYSTPVSTDGKWD